MSTDCNETYVDFMNKEIPYLFVYVYKVHMVDYMMFLTDLKCTKWFDVCDHRLYVPLAAFVSGLCVTTQYLLKNTSLPLTALRSAGLILFQKVHNEDFTPSLSI